MLPSTTKGAQLVSRPNVAALQRGAARRQPARRMRCQPVLALSDDVEWCLCMLNVGLLVYAIARQHRLKTKIAMIEAQVATLQKRRAAAKMGKLPQQATDDNDSGNSAA